MALNNLQKLICHKTQTKNKRNNFFWKIFVNLYHCCIAFLLYMEIFFTTGVYLLILSPFQCQVCIIDGCISCDFGIRNLKQNLTWTIG